ncbi:MAG TPA: COX15/CtaA family protein [Burkholderiales bacterium]|jgi:cytochrome c oxidase assembly protein subunit 15|nr:COX15/CtaA family protein [Burkholderiales bacterium]
MALAFRRLAYFTAGFALFVIVVGAYVRLEDAGLGCPDWPGCYGQLVGVPDQAHEIERAGAAFQKTVDVGRARKEMFHRYIAGTLGLLIAAIAVMSWRGRARLHQSPLLASALVLLVVFQAALGMWTVTLLLKPAIVTLHLLGGMTTLALLTWLARRQSAAPGRAVGAAALRLRGWAVLALAIVFVQIALGGWVSANYAALACIDFPTCGGEWLPAMDFRHAFHLVRELGVTAAGAPLSHQALIAIQWTHRLGALITFVVVGTLALAALRVPPLRRYGCALLALLFAQIALGIANVLLRLPLAVAVTHNGVAAVLLGTLVMLNFALFRQSRR